MKIYNSLSNKVEEFNSITKNVVNMYVCGPTVYNYVHIGNARPLVFFDTLRKILTFLGYKVNYASNITDIDDRIIKASLASNCSEESLSTFYTKAYFKLYGLLNAKIPTFTPRATKYVDSMIKYISDLLAQDYAYKVESGVYFRVKKVSDFGILSNRSLESEEEGHRVNLESDKESSEDFALWKFTKTGLRFEAPFGVGRPGWHTECVCMISDLFSTPIDIHGGGIDLIFPHHENEIAQCMAHDHNILANYWVHVNFLNMGSIKMSKSLGNIEYAHLVALEVGGLALRLFLLSTNYRVPITYSKELLLVAKAKMDQITKVIRTKLLLINTDSELLKAYSRRFSKKDYYSKEYFARFIDELSNDINCANAISIIYETLKKFQKQKLDLELVSDFKTFIQMLKMLGLYKSIHVGSEVIELYKKYNEYKSNGQYSLSDEIRIKLINLGYM